MGIFIIGLMFVEHIRFTFEIPLILQIDLRP